MKMQYVSIAANDIPCVKRYYLNGTPYLFRFLYNSKGDFYTLTVLDTDGEVVISNKLSYMRNTFGQAPSGFGKIKLIPVSPAEFDRAEDGLKYSRLGASNFAQVRLGIVL